MLEVVVTPLAVAPPGVEAVLASDEKHRATSFVRERDRRRYVAARVRLRQLLGERLGVVPGDIRFAYAPAGKPRLAAGYARDLRFNVSHCEDLAVYAFAEGAEVGVDVEAERALDDAEEIAAQCFSPAEYQAYRARGFQYCWTRKEAYLKALGVGLQPPLQAFDAAAAPRGWRMESFRPAPGFVAALAVEEKKA